MRFILSILLWVTFSSSSYATGKLLLVGGGSEVAGGWSDAPYRWMVEQAANKRIAIISTDAGSDPLWLVNYFKSLGASYARNFEFPAAGAAQAPLLYDSLMTYDGMFFKGGDQWLYYSFFNDTPVEQAVVDKFEEGGVIGGTSAGMAILGEHTYTAENASLLPWEGLENVYNSNITIESDFAPLLKDYLTDTHFLERGRIPRLNSMMANIFLTKQKNVKGIACDDQTAVTIDAQQMATVFGTGGAYFYSDGLYSVVNSKWSGNIQAVHLSHGMQLNLPTLAILNGPKFSTTTSGVEKVNTPVLLCGNTITDQSAEVVQKLATRKDTMVIVTGESRVMAASLLQSLNRLGKMDVIVMSSTSDNNTDEEWKLRNTIRQSKSIVFINNDFDLLRSFLQEGPTGELLYDHIHRDGVFSAYFGLDCKLAGAFYCENNLSDPTLAYYGGLIYKEGLGVLSASIIIPQAFDPDMADYYENNVLSGLYALAKYNLSFSHHIGSDSWMELTQKDGANYFSANGKYGAVIIRNTSGFHEPFSVITSSKPRNNAAFDSLGIVVLNSQNQIEAGKPVIQNSPPYELESPPVDVISGLAASDPGWSIFPTITSSGVSVVTEDDYKVWISTMNGTDAAEYDLPQGTYYIPLGKAGIYVIRFARKKDGFLIKSQKIIKQ